VTERERVIRLNGIGGVTFKTRIEKFDPGFFVEALQRHVIPSGVEESLIVFGNTEAKQTDMFRFAQNDKTRRVCCRLQWI
jgi:hypothetical protein